MSAKYIQNTINIKMYRYFFIYSLAMKIDKQ